ncbi:uncharacterized protein LOC114273481 [Camellia sinensis]|uniref:Pollen Ole e 1 allergen and extensin family protein n=1 Tax=Camellia sinensis var. sinensis TaxID=542762 RepID=A0A4S4ECI6_CAMSN|nr:uncharacterized protein LOC114273481 [Camellia sinensis]THG13983.1 hypothetical protein TEA_024852 [Camellia sinensis var. sinensis]
MAIHHKVIITALLFALLVLARVEFSTCHVLKGSVTCLDCHNHHDLSDIKVLVKCSQVRKLAVATTSADGTFETELPSDATPPSSFNCLANILGGPKQLYTSKKNIVSRTLKLSNSDDSYTISKPLKFFTSNPSSSSKNAAAIGESKTVDIPLPPAWGLAPSSYYIPFVPIIGIP